LKEGSEKQMGLSMQEKKALTFINKMDGAISSGVVSAVIIVSGIAE